MYLTCALISELVTSVLLYYTDRCVQAEGDAGLRFVDRLLLSLIFHCSKDEDHPRAMRDMEKAFSCASDLHLCECCNENFTILQV
jgi:hypothetical protein